MATTKLYSESELKYAQNFSISHHESYKKVEIRGNGHAQAIYYLVSQDQKPNNLPGDGRVIRTPVQHIVTTETVHLAFLAELGAYDHIVGIGSIAYSDDSRAKELIANGQARNIGEGQAIDPETVLSLNADLILLSANTGEQTQLQAQLHRAEQPVVHTSSFLEGHPLARAEWIKLIAAFLEQDEIADQFFETLEERYQSLARRVDTGDDRPTVFCNVPYSGIWYMPGGNSYIAQIIHDAGGHYLWDSSPSIGAYALDIESVFETSLHADYWINLDFHRSMKSLLSADFRFRKLNAVKQWNAYNNTRQALPNGGNTFWHRGVVRPDEILADLIRILHPERLPKHELIYYEQLR